MGCTQRNIIITINTSKSSAKGAIYTLFSGLLLFQNNNISQFLKF